MASLAEIRSQYPQYSSLSDEDFSGRLYERFYVGKIPREEFNTRVGLPADFGLKSKGDGDQRYKGGVWEDVGRSAAAGFIRGGLNLAASAVSPATAMTLPGEMEQTLEDVTGRKFHNPQTGWGEVAGTAAEFIPGGVAGGGGGTVGKLAKDALRYGAAPGAASELAGQSLEGTDAEPIARVVAPMLVGGGAALASRGRPPAPPSTREMRTAASAKFNAAEGSGIVIKPESFSAAVDRITRTAMKEGLDPVNSPAANRVVEILQDWKGRAVDYADLNTLRKNIGDAAGAPSRGDRRLAMVIKDEFQDFMTNLGDADVDALGAAGLVGGADIKAATQALRDAVKTSAAAFKSEEIQNIMAKAERAVARGRASQDAAIRDGFAQLANNPKRMRGFTPSEREAIENIVAGNGKIATWLARLPSGAFTSAGAVLIAGPAGLAVPAAGMTARGVAGRSTLKRANALDETIRNDGKAMPRRPSALKNMAKMAPFYLQGTGNMATGGPWTTGGGF